MSKWFVIRICNINFINEVSFFGYRARWVKVDGMEYKRKVGVVYDMTDDLPKVGQITSIYVINHNTVIFAVKCFSSVYVEHFRAYTLHTLSCDKLVCVHDLLLPNPVHIRTASSLPGSKFVILPYHISVQV